MDIHGHQPVPPLHGGTIYESTSGNVDIYASYIQTTYYYALNPAVSYGGFLKCGYPLKRMVYRKIIPLKWMITRGTPI